jgi:hypothetical protein
MGPGPVVPIRHPPAGAGTFLGGVLDTLPFLFTRYRAALIVALATTALRRRIVPAAQR